MNARLDAAFARQDAAFARLDAVLLWFNLGLVLVLLFLIDRVLITVVRRLLWFPLGIPAARHWQHLGEEYFLAAVALAILLFDRRNRHRALMFGLILLMTAIPVHASKMIIGKQRPDVAAGESAFRGPARGFIDSDYQSFPSGHTATAFAIAGMTGLWYPAFRVPALILAGGVGVSRVYTMWHFPSDVYAGAILGLCVAKWLARSKRLEDAARGVMGKLGMMNDE